MKIEGETYVPEAQRITTAEQAVHFVEALIEEMAFFRRACDVRGVSVEQVRRNCWTFINKQGQALGAAKALVAVGLLPERAYKEFAQRALNALIPTVGPVGGDT